VTTVLEFPVSRLPELETVARRLLPQVKHHIQDDKLDGVFWYYGLLSRAWAQIAEEEA
jgi:hypothetical protein